jgi:hypothetical protein
MGIAFKMLASIPLDKSIKIFTIRNVNNKFWMLYIWREVFMNQTYKITLLSVFLACAGAIIASSKEEMSKDLQARLLTSINEPIPQAPIDLPRLPSDPLDIRGDLELGDIREATTHSESSIKQTRKDRWLDWLQGLPDCILTKVSTASAMLSQITSLSILWHALGGEHFFGLFSEHNVEAVYRADANVAIGCTTAIAGVLYYIKTKYGESIFDQLKKLIKKNPMAAIVIIADTLIGMTAAVGENIDWIMDGHVIPKEIYVAASTLTTTLNVSALLKYLCEKIIGCVRSKPPIEALMA